jgi:hypothetical protein
MRQRTKDRLGEKGLADLPLAKSADESAAKLGGHTPCVSEKIESAVDTILYLASFL